MIRTWITLLAGEVEKNAKVLLADGDQKTRCKIMETISEQMKRKR